ncbi:MAG: DUF4249 domain-containing protein [Bacteroidales bacterium]|nr:DUF4249 domain-containing protein [Bacteroidales bacterium]
MNILKTILIITILSFLFSCEKTVTDIELPQQEPKLVVNAYISPEDTIIQVNVSLSHPIFKPYDYNDNNQSVENATVKISSNGNELIIPYNFTDYAYISSTSNFPIVEGQTYRLDVSTPDGKSVNASCTVPKKNSSIQHLSTDTVNDEWGGKMLRIKIKFFDLQGVGNFYRVGGALDYVDLYGSITDTFSSGLSPKYNLEFFTDATNDGEDILSELNYWTYDESEWMHFTRLRIFLLSVDSHYYNFHKSLSNYQGDSPFSEPTIIYSNIEGGMGAFAAYRKHVINVTIN